MTTPSVEDLQMQNNAHDQVSRRTIYELVIAVMFTAVIIWSVHSLMDPGTLPIRQVRIEGDFTYLSTASLEKLIRHEAKGGFFNIDVMAIRQSIMAEPWVKEVSVHRIWPDKLQVYVNEQIAVTRWKENALLNKSGDIFIPDQETFPDNLPGLSGPDQNRNMIFQKYNDLASQFEKTGFVIQELALDERRSWQFTTNDGLLVVIGRRDFDARTRRFVELIPATLGPKISEAERIDMRYPNGFAVRWKQAGNGIQLNTGA